MTIAELKQRFPQNHIITDDRDEASVMVYVKKFYLDEVIDGASHLPHPAFVVDGKELDGIYISKFQNVLIDGRAYSLPDRDPATHIDFDNAVQACTSKGAGFHLMSAAEWGAIALWCLKNGWLPFGNNDMGKDIREDQVRAKISYYDAERSICRTATASAPIEWSHNKQSDGIYDLCANVWEWVGGFRLVRGELQVLANNDAACAKFSQSATSGDWRAIDGKSGELIMPSENASTPNSVKLDFVGDHWVYTSGEFTSSLDDIRFCRFADVTADASVCDKAKELLLALGILPSHSYCENEVSLYANNGADERISFRGGRWGQGLNTGVFKCCLDDPRSFSGDAVGFRSAYYEA